VPDRAGETAGDLDLGDLGAALAAGALLGPLIALGIGRVFARLTTRCWWTIKSGHSVEFVSEAQVKGTDFDLLVDGTVPLEVTAKEDDPAYTPTALASTLADARGQLPRTGPGVIALRIPDAWVANARFVGYGDAEFQRALRNSRRTNAILVLWDSWVREPPTGIAWPRSSRLGKEAADRAVGSCQPRPCPD
jgi:hypothetical protein